MRDTSDVGRDPSPQKDQEKKRGKWEGATDVCYSHRTKTCSAESTQKKNKWISKMEECAWRDWQARRRTLDERVASWNKLISVGICFPVRTKRASLCYGRGGRTGKQIPTE